MLLSVLVAMMHSTTATGEGVEEPSLDIDNPAVEYSAEEEREKEIQRIHENSIGLSPKSELTPKSLKQDAITELETINASKKSVQLKIDKSTWFINKSLDDKLWIDDWHLNSTTMMGALVFNMEKAAVLKLEAAKKKRAHDRRRIGACD